MTSALAHACLEKRTDAAGDLTFLKRPQCRPPALDHVAETFDPYGAGFLAAPHVHQVHFELGGRPARSAAIAGSRSVHSFTNPASNDPAHGVLYNERSDVRSWTAMQDFLREVFAK